MAAFDIPVTLYTVFLVIAGHSLSGAIAVTPGGLGTTQAIDTVILRHYTSASNATAFSFTQDAIITAWNIVFGMIVMSWTFGWSETRQLVRERKQDSARMEGERHSDGGAEGAPVGTEPTISAAAGTTPAND